MIGGLSRGRATRKLVTSWADTPRERARAQWSLTRRTLKETAEVMGISLGRVQQIEREAMHKLWRGIAEWMVETGIADEEDMRRMGCELRRPEPPPRVVKRVRKKKKPSQPKLERGETVPTRMQGVDGPVVVRVRKREGRQAAAAGNAGAIEENTTEAQRH